MPISRDKSRGTFVFEFDRVINGVRVRARKRLPKAWSTAQADEYERKESARLYATANGVGSEDRLIDDAVAVYLTERVPNLKQGHNAARELGLIAWAYTGKPMSTLADVCRAVAQKSGKSRYGKDMAPATIRARIRYLVAACRYAWKYHGFGANDPGARVITPQVRDFFGVRNLIEDGQCLHDQLNNTLHMNPRTWDRVRAAAEKGQTP